MSSAASPGDSAPRPAAPRSVKRSLASIVLGFETIVMFLASLVFFGLGALPPVLALGGGAVFCLIMVATVALLKYEWAYAVGWAIQAVVILTGFLNPVMFVIGAIFAAMWVYCMVNGSRIDHQKEIA